MNEDYINWLKDLYAADEINIIDLELAVEHVLGGGFVGRVEGELIYGP